MKVGYYVQGDADEALIQGLAERWCTDAELAEGRFRGSSRVSFRRELTKALSDLHDDKECDVLVVLTDGDANRWQDVKRREWTRVPEFYRHLTALGVADRNVECWVALDRVGLARELGCGVEDIPADDPSGFVKRGFGLNRRETKEAGRRRIREYVREARLKVWIEECGSFGDFYGAARSLGMQSGCDIPNEMDN